MSIITRLFLLLLGSVITHRPGRATVLVTVPFTVEEDTGFAETTPITFPAPHTCAAMGCEHTAPCWPCMTCLVDCSCPPCLQAMHANTGKRHQAMVVLAQWAPEMTHEGLTMWAKRAGVPPFPAHLNGMSRAQWIQVAAIEASEGRAVSPSQFPEGSAGWLAAKALTS